IARHSAGPGKKPLQLIFHMGHCGSTLISRLLGDLHGVVSLREPLPLRDLATEWAEHTSPWAVRSASAQLKDWSLLRNLWCRTWTDDGTAIVKATSFCDLLAAEWLTQFSADTALLIHVSPKTYLRSMFVHDGYLNDIYGSSRARILPHQETLDGAFAPLGELALGERVALAFICAALNHAAALDAGAKALDFDRFLERPEDGLSSAAAALALSPSAAEIKRVLGGQIALSYSKATEYPFSAADRETRMKEADSRRGADIRHGLEKINAVRANNPAIDRAIARLGY
ncbi:MAG: hypothetical protein AAGK23_13415, partial [Pseudomonadota bacterium]